MQKRNREKETRFGQKKMEEKTMTRTIKHFVMGVTMGTMLFTTATGLFAENEVNERQERQQQRIANGVANGSMTAHETAKVESQEAAIHHEIKTDRQANGGKLTAQEHAQVNRQQNHESREIFRDKHNARNQRN
jgi:hypothetical protein